MATFSGYRAFGLNIASEFAIPGGIRLEQPVSDPDIVISAGDAVIGKVDAVNGPYSRSGNALLFDAAGVARYFAPSAEMLFIEPYHGADRERVGNLLIATALPMLLWMRGGLVLHAAGLVPVGMDQAVAISGPSGIGKSTVAAGLIANGAQLVGDDSLWLTLRDSDAVVSGLSTILHRSNKPDSPRTATDIPPESQRELVSLGGIVTLRMTDDDTPPAQKRLRGADAIEALLRNRHRPKIPALLGREAALLQQSILHCRTLPIYEFAMKYGDVAGSQQHMTSLISDLFRSV